MVQPSDEQTGQNMSYNHRNIRSYMEAAAAAVSYALTLSNHTKGVA